MTSLGPALESTKLTTLRDWKNTPLTMAGRCDKSIMRARDDAVNIDAGRIERKIFSNCKVKSKSSLQPWTLGPRDSSSRHPENSKSNISNKQDLYQSMVDSDAGPGDAHSRLGQYIRL